MERRSIPQPYTGRFKTLSKKCETVEIPFQSKVFTTPLCFYSVKVLIEASAMINTGSFDQSTTFQEEKDNPTGGSFNSFLIPATSISIISRTPQAWLDIDNDEFSTIGRIDSIAASENSGAAASRHGNHGSHGNHGNHGNPRNRKKSVIDFSRGINVNNPIEVLLRVA